jgi:hypothetical protein
VTQDGVFEWSRSREPQHGKKEQRAKWRGQAESGKNRWRKDVDEGAVEDARIVGIE